MTEVGAATDPALPEKPPVPLAEAKLTPPVLRPDTIDRPRIAKTLDRRPWRALTLVAAPAGYGKTIAVRQWCEDRGAGLAWVTLDGGDDDPVRLWMYVATAVDRVRQGLGRAALQRLRIPGASIETAIDELMNGITTLDRELVVVLDELETVSDPACLATIDYVVDRLPENARLVLVTRSDPSLRIGRIRARRALVELRGGELAFTPAEIRALFRVRTTLELTDDELELLRSRTEGWPAALELMALWLRDVDDPRRMMREFTGDHRFVAEFLSHEVLDALDDDVREFVLRASVLGRVTAALCDSVLRRSDSASMLATLERSSLLVTRFERGGWFRVHPLFAEFAAFRLAAQDPGAAAELHRRAAGYCMAHELLVDAIHHAAAAGDLDLVARLLDDAHLALIRGGGAATVLRWASLLRDEQLLAHPGLAAAAATAALVIGHRTAERRRYLALVDRAVPRRPEGEEAYARSVAEMVRASSLDGGVGDAVESGRLSVELAEAGVEAIFVGAYSGYARALYFAGDLEGARRAALRAAEHPEAERRPPGHAFAQSTLALVATDRGHLSSARRHAEKARSIMGGIGTSRSWLGASAAAALGVVHLAEGDLVQAESELASAERFYREEIATIHHAWLLLLLARVRCRRGRLGAAGDALRSAREELDELGGPAGVETLAVEVAEELGRARANAGAGELLEGPSDAEQSVLRLLATDLSVREIGAELYLSANTVRSHVRSLYRKLGVHARADAVARAEALGLVETPRSPR